jgi:nucleotide-binding universal stress UspA family protein
MAEAALAHAVAVAAGLGAQVVLLRVVEAHAALTDPAVSTVDWRLQRMESAAYLREVSARLETAGLEVATEVVEGGAADEIVQFIRDHAVDLVVVAAHGRGGARDFPFGGTVHKIVSSAAASVMIVRQDAGGDAAPAAPRYRRILVPVDGSSPSEWALFLAAGIARKHGAELLVLQVVPEVELTCERIPRSAEETELLDRLRTLQKDRAARYLEEIESKLSHEDLAVRSRVVWAGQVAEGLQQVAAEEGADLIALAAHGAAEARFPYGKVAQRLLAQSDLPVLVFQDLPGATWAGCPPAGVSPS